MTLDLSNLSRVIEEIDSEERPVEMGDIIAQIEPGANVEIVRVKSGSERPNVAWTTFQYEICVEHDFYKTHKGIEYYVHQITAGRNAFKTVVMEALVGKARRRIACLRTQTYMVRDKKLNIIHCRMIVTWGVME